MSDTRAQWAGLYSPRELAEDISRKWRLLPFRPSGAIEVEHQGVRLLRKLEPNESASPDGEWDHEHCEGCYAKISLHPDDQNAGYTDGELWICESCYRTHIEPLLKP